MRHLAALLFSVYVLVHSANGDSVRSYDGISKDQVTGLVQNEGKDFEVITETDYKTFLAARPDKLPTLSEEKTALKKIATDKSKTVTQRLDALVDYLDIR